MKNITIRRGNTELTVPEDQKERYLKLGYSVYENGKMVEEAPLKDAGALQRRVSELLQENASLKAENKKLKTELAKTKKTDNSKSNK